MTSANMIGVSSGTTSSRGVRAVSWKRRRASVASGWKPRARAGCGNATAVVTADIGSLLSGGSREAVAGEAQVHVVKSRRARADLRCEPELVDDGDRRAAGGLVKRDCQRRADRERVGARDLPLA